MKYLLCVLCCLTLSGCCFKMSWNYIRAGYLDDETIKVGESEYVRENTYGLYLKWAPDIDWSEVWSKINSKEE